MMSYQRFNIITESKLSKTYGGKPLPFFSNTLNCYLKSKCKLLAILILTHATTTYGDQLLVSSFSLLDNLSPDLDTYIHTITYNKHSHKITVFSRV